MVAAGNDTDERKDFTKTWRKLNEGSEFLGLVSISPQKRGSPYLRLCLGVN
jgi:hypothetical protein